MKWLYRLLIPIIAYGYVHPGQIQRLLPQYLFSFIPLPEWRRLYDFQEVDFRNADGLLLKGYWLPSRQPDASKTIVMAHGYMAQAATMVSLAQEMYQQGINVFLFDFRAHGRSQYGKMTLGFDEGKDVAAAILYVKSHYPEVSQKVFYLGHSMGAAALMMAPKSLAGMPELLQQLEDSLDGIILDSSFSAIRLSDTPFVMKLAQLRWKNTFLKAVWKFISPQLTHALTQMLLIFEPHSQKAFGLPFPLTDLRPLVPFQHSRLSQKPILIIHGTQDKSTDFEQGQYIYEALKKSAMNTLRFVELNADHINRLWKPTIEKSSYQAVLRDEQIYLDALLQFIRSH